LRAHITSDSYYRVHLPSAVGRVLKMAIQINGHLHLVVCAVSLYWASEAFKQRLIFWVWALGINAFLFSPIFPIRMSRSDWEIIDIVAAAYLVTWLSFSGYRDWRMEVRKPE
jgi:hypothetical protein